MDVNSKDWWNEEHKNNWINDGINGIKQTKMFADISYGILNPAIKENIIDLEHSFVDWGCALGQGCQYLLNKLNPLNNKIYGVDIAESAIIKARTIYPEYNFLYDIDFIEDEIDLIYTSNTLEHFVSPTEYIDKLIKKTNKYLIMLMPHMQEPTGLHFFKFDNDYFANLSKHFKDLNINANLIQYTIVSPIDRWYSPTNQVLAVYYKEE